jgi:ribosomal protein L7Ae-like RNA K-turn-binding protein
MSVLDALKGVLKLSLMHDGLARGEEEAYKKLVIALCSEHKIPLIKVPDGKQLGEWAGLCESRPAPEYLERGKNGEVADWIVRVQASLTVRATPARSSTALASSSRTGVRSRRSAPSSSTTSSLRLKRTKLERG